MTFTAQQGFAPLAGISVLVNLDRTFVRHVHRVDAGGRGECRAGHMGRGANTARSVVQRPRRAPRRGDQVGHGAVGRTGLTTSTAGLTPTRMIWVSRRGVEFRAGLQQLLCDVGECAQHQRVAVGGLLCDELGGEDAAGAHLASCNWP